jgi:hypothetical protein
MFLIICYGMSNDDHGVACVQGILALVISYHDGLSWGRFGS